jgi:hypothetical protein
LPVAERACLVALQASSALARCGSMMLYKIHRNQPATSEWGTNQVPARPPSAERDRERP